MNVKWPFKPCRRHAASLSLLAAEALPEGERAAVAAHVAHCDACRSKLAALRAIAGSLTQLGRHLPEAEAPASLRRRWVAAVRCSSRERAPGQPALPGWLSTRRLAWGSLTAIWALVLFFRLSAPDAPKPASIASALPVSLREVLLALKVEERESRRRADASPPPHQQSPPSDALPPRSQRPGAPSTTTSVIT